MGRRHSYFGQPDYRIYELNKRLQQRTDVSENVINSLNGQSSFELQLKYSNLKFHVYLQIFKHQLIESIKHTNQLIIKFTT